MKIFLASFGFLQEYMITIANYLSDKNEVFLLMPQKDIEHKLKSKIRKNVNLQFIEMPKSTISPDNIKVVRDFLELVKLTKPDIIHIQAHGFDWFFLAFPFLKDYTVVNTVHDPQRHLGEERYRHALFRIRFGVKSSDHLIVHGLYSKKKLISDYKISKDKISVVPHPNFSIYKEWQKERSADNRIALLFYGRIREYKGLQYFVEACSKISEKYPDMKFVIAGRGKINSKCKKIIEENDSIILKNYFIDNAETAELFCDADILVLPYIDASQSGVLAISYAFGKPVIATNMGSLGEYIIDGKTGYLVPPKDSQAIYEKALFLLENTEKRINMGRNCMIFSERILSDTRLSELNQQVYQKAITRKTSQKI